MIKRSAVKIFKYAFGYTYDKNISAFRKGGLELARLPIRREYKPVVPDAKDIAERLRKFKIHFANETRKFARRVKRFRKDK